MVLLFFVFKCIKKLKFYYGINLLIVYERNTCDERKKMGTYIGRR